MLFKTNIFLRKHFGKIKESGIEIAPRTAIDSFDE